MRTMNVIVLNSPPRTGKDTLAAQIATQYPEWQVVRFAQPLVDWSKGLGLSDGSQVSWDAFKLREFEDGKIGRDFVVEYSENVLKPMVGYDFFAKSLADSCQRSDHVVITDAGFDYELQAFNDELVSRYGVHPRFLLVHLSREGFDFSNDSRGFVSLEDLSLQPSQHISEKWISSNPETMDVLASDLVGVFRGMLLQEAAHG